MPAYQLYFLNAQNHTLPPGQTVECADDDEAMLVASTLLDVRPEVTKIEIWERTRLVAAERRAANSSKEAIRSGDG